MIQKIKKPISILLSLLMVLSVFVVVPVTASAAATYTKDSAGIDDGITLVNPGDTIYTSDTSGSLLFYSDITCDYSNDGTNLGVIPCGNLWSDVDSFSINDNYMYICSSYGEPSTFIPDDGKVLKVSYRSDIDLWIIAAVDPSAIPQTPVFYTKDSEGIADGIILDSATDMICTVNTSRILVFDCDVQCDYNNEGTSVFDIRKGDTWYDTSSFLINDNNDFLFINSGTSSKLTSGSGTPFKVSYDSSENKWHIIDGSEPVPLPDDLFVKVTSEDQVTEDNIGACTFSDAKEWVYDHWDEITNGVDDGYIDFNFVYVDSNNALGYKKTFGFYLNDISTKEMFKANCNSSYVTEIDSIKESYSSDILYLCKVRDPEPATYTVTWKNWNGDVLKTDTGVAEGSTPSYDGETPTKDGVTFAGWTDSHGVFYAKDAVLPEVTADETYTAVFELTIGSVDEWNSFAASVKGGNTYSGIIVRMTADVGPVTTMVDGTFSGTFDGDGHTLTVNISGGSTSAATFADVKDATIQNLRLEGTVTSSGIHTAALVKSVSDTGSTCTIKNVDIYADVNCSQDYIGGFIGHAGTVNTVNIENCIFAGSINKTGSTQGNFIGAFIGWSQTLTATINNCAFTGSYNNIKSFNNIGFSYNAPTKVTVSGFYSNASEVFVANVNHGTRLYVPSSSYSNAVALVKNNDGETFYSAFSDALAAWTDGSTLALLADVTCDSMISVPADTSKILDLNGKTLTTVANNTVYGTLTIQSTVSGGNITHTNKSQVISVQEEATLNINSGTIHGYNADRAVIGGGEGGTYNLNGGKIVTSASNAFSIGSGSTLNLNGGEIECTSGSTSMGTASAVWAHGDSTINWNGTAITTNTGDGIRMKSAGNGTVNVTGGSFTATSSSLPEEGGYAVYVNSNMSSLNLKGNPNFSGRGIYLTNDKVINITDELSNTNPISVTMQTPGVFTSGLAENGDATNFANGNGTGYALTLNASGEAQIVSTYTITWNNWDDTELEKDTGVAEGANPEYNGATPQKPDDATNYYTFSGWDPEVSAVTGDATYTATFTESEKPEAIKDCNNKYGNFRLYSNVPIVSFSNVNDLLTGAIIPITYGDNNSMIPLVDAKGYSYKLYDQTGTEIPFEITSSESEPGSDYGFSDDVTVYTNVINFTRPAGCTAIYIVATEPDPITYTVTWMNGDDILETDTDLEPGALPSYDGETPTKDEDDDFTYEFIGWTCGPNFYEPEELPIVDGDTTYVATFESTPKHEAGYYVVGTMTEWKIDDAYLLTANTEAEGDEFVLSGVALTSNDAIKVVKYEPGNWTWYPDGMDNNYEITADGTYDIYFRPNSDGGDDWFEGCIYVVVPPHVHDFIYCDYGDTIEAICTASGCDLTDDNEVTLTIVAPTLTIVGQTGDGISEYATLTGLEAFNEATGLNIAETDIKYYAVETVEIDGNTYKRQGDELDGAPTDAGEYIAGLTLSDVKISETATRDVTARTWYTITEPAPTYTVTWMNGDEVLETDENVEPGALPSYDGDTPTKDEDDDFTYDFIGWTCGPNFYTPDELPIVDGDTTYVATFESTPKHEAGYYVVGTMTEWKIDDAYLLTANTEAEGDEFMLNNVAFTDTDAIKVVKYEAGQDWTWYPSGTGNDYAITADGTYDIYFRPNADGGEEWYENCIKAVNVTEYTITWKNDDGSVIDTTTVVYGDTPTHADATKATDRYYTYTFAGWTPELAAVTGDAEYTAQFTPVAKMFMVFVKRPTGSTINVYDLTGETTVAQLKAIIAEKENIPVTEQKLIFAGTQLENDKTLAEYNIYKESTLHLVLNKYTVTWMVGEEIVETDENVEYGATPVYDGAEPEKAEDDDYTYAFAGWTDGENTYAADAELPAVTGDVTYTAVFDSTAKHEAGYYVVGTMTEWKIEDDYLLTANTDAEGDEYMLNGVALTDSDAIKVVKYEPGNWTWYPDGEGNDYEITADGTYDIYFRPNCDGGDDWYEHVILAVNVTEYTITWKNDDGTVIDTTTVVYGDTPTHADATKDADAQYTYNFTGWTPEVVAATADAEYTATFDSVVNEYTITWKNDDGTVIDTTTVAYGEVPTHSDATKDATAQYTYTFTGWDTEPVAVTGDAEYTATFSSTVNEYTITWKNDDGTVIDTTTVAYGDTPTHADATKDATAQYTYNFTGWTPEVVAVTGDAEYTASFDSVVNEYTITWKNDDGSVIDTTTVAYGEVPTHADATKDATAQYTYTFTGWDTEPVAVTGDAEYTATFSSAVNEYTITWKNDDGTVIDTTTVAYGDTPTHAEATKDATEQYTYTFKAWTPEVVAVTGDAEYTATFDEVKKPLLGDADGDGEVTVIDATMIQRVLASMPGAVVDKAAADVDGDGEVTVVDATYIQRYLASMPVAFPINEYVD